MELIYINYVRGSLKNIQYKIVGDVSLITIGQYPIGRHSISKIFSRIVKYY